MLDGVALSRLAGATPNFPRTVVLDLTPVGGPSATGQLKATLLREWPKEKLLVFSGSREVHLLDAESTERPVSVPEALTLAREFRPQVVLYRPVPQSPRLHEIAMALFRDDLFPFAVWIVDDWPRTQRVAAQAVFGPAHRDLRNLLHGSSVNLAISDQMAEELGHRYSTVFEVVHNGVPLQRIQNKTGNSESDVGSTFGGSLPFLLGYRGAVTRQKESRTLDEVAGAIQVARRQWSLPIEFEIATAPIFSRQLERLKNRGAFSIGQFVPDNSAYLDRLQGYNALLIAYNFSASSKRYLRLSLPNKLPELLVSGRPILYVGPKTLPVARILSSSNSAILITSPHRRQLIRGFRNLMQSSDCRADVVESARQLALARFVLEDQQHRLLNLLSRAAAG